MRGCWFEGETWCMGDTKVSFHGYSWFDYGVIAVYVWFDKGWVLCVVCGCCSSIDSGQCTDVDKPLFASVFLLFLASIQGKLNQNLFKSSFCSCSNVQMSWLLHARTLKPYLK